MNLLRMIILLLVATLLTACGPDLQQEVDALQRNNASLATANQALQAQVGALQNQINAYDRAAALAKARSAGKELAKIEAIRRLAAFAPVCRFVPLLCSQALKRDADEAMSLYKPDPGVATAFVLIVLAVLCALAVAMVVVLWRLYARSIQPELLRVNEARSVIAEAEERRVEFEQELEATRAATAQERKTLDGLRLQGATARRDLKELDAQLGKTKEEVATLRAECDKLRRLRDALSGL